MSEQYTTKEDALWAQLVKAHLAYTEALRQFWAEKDNRVALIKKGLQQGDRATAMHLIPSLPSTDISLLFDELLKLAIYSHSYGQAARDAILSMPRQWVLKKIESSVEPYFHQADYDVYRGVLELYALLDNSLTYQLASEISHHADPDIREVGQDFLDRLTALKQEVG